MSDCYLLPFDIHHAPLGCTVLRCSPLECVTTDPFVQTVPLSVDPAAIFKESSFFPLFCQPAAKDDGDDDENDDLAYLNQPADDLGQLDDDDGDGDGDEEDQGGGEEEEDQLEEHGVEQRVHAEAEVV